MFLLPTCRVTPCFHRSALYLPKAGPTIRRLKATYVPDNVSFSTKPQLAVEMIERALALACRSVGCADSVYGSAISSEPPPSRKGYVLRQLQSLVCIMGKPQRLPHRRELAKRSDIDCGVYRRANQRPRLHTVLPQLPSRSEDFNHHSQVLYTRLAIP